MPIRSAEMHTLNGLFKEGLYQIPDYQRRYSWEEKQNEELFNDLWEGFESNTDHYLGTLSLCEGKDIGKYSSYQIIDGQQRFTSLLILFSVLIHCDKTDEFDIKDLRLEYKGESIYFLEPINLEDKEYLSAILGNEKLKNEEIPEPSSKSQKLMKDAHRIYCNAIGTKVKQDKVQDPKIVENFALYVMKQATFLIHLVRDEKSASRMFEAINDRGLPLKYFDKIKATLLYISDKEYYGKFKEKIVSTFNKIYQFIDKSEYVLKINNDDTLLLYHFLSHPELFESVWGYTTPTVDIYNGIKKRILQKEDNDKFITEYLKDISKFIDAVDRIEQMLQEENEKYNELYRILASPQSIYPISIRLEILKQLEPNIDNLIISSFYCKARRDPQAHVYKALDKIIEDQDDADEIEDIIERLKRSSKGNVDTLEEVAKKDWATKYILYIYSREECKETIPYNSLKDMEIEHICPINPEYIKSLGWGVREQYDHDIESIGNKLLIEKKTNKKVSNKLPSDKISEYNKSKFKMNHDIEVKKKPDVFRREKELIKFIKSYLDR